MKEKTNSITNGNFCTKILSIKIKITKEIFHQTKQSSLKNKMNIHFNLIQIETALQVQSKSKKMKEIKLKEMIPKMSYFK